MPPGMAETVGTAADTIGWGVIIGCMFGLMIAGSDTGIAMCPVGTMAGDIVVTMVGTMVDTMGGASTTTPGCVGRTPAGWVSTPPMAIAAAVAALAWL